MLGPKGPCLGLFCVKYCSHLEHKFEFSNEFAHIKLRISQATSDSSNSSITKIFGCRRLQRRNLKSQNLFSLSPSPPVYYTKLAFFAIKVLALLSISIV